MTDPLVFNVHQAHIIQALVVDLIQHVSCAQQESIVSVECRLSLETFLLDIMVQQTIHHLNQLVDY
jgi:hypothetical protein